MAKTTITRAEYLQLVGLLAPADAYARKLEDVFAAARALTGEADDNGHTADAVYGRRADADGLLRRLGITAEPPA